MKEWKQEEWTGESRNPEPRQRRAGMDENRAARDKGLYYLQFSSKTESELRKKLAEQGFSPASVDSAAAFLKSYRYLDDEDYVRRYLEKNGRKKSKKQMEYELHLKGVSKDMLAAVFEEMPVDETEQILALLEKRKYPRGGAERELRQKTTAFLVRKGFSYDAINTAFARWERGGSERG